MEYRIIYSDELYHHGVKGMKWGVRNDRSNAGSKDYRPTSIRSAVARRQNDKVDKNFKKWKEGSAKKADAIALGKKKNVSQMEWEKDRHNKEKKAQYKADNKEYKKALKQNTEYRKGTVRQEVGKDLSRKYMTEAKRAKKAGDDQTYSKFMNKHDIERARARKAQDVGQRRSNYKAAAKRSMKMAAKAAITSAVVGAGVKYAQKKGYNISLSDVDKYSTYVNMAKKAMSYMY